MNFKFFLMGSNWSAAYYSMDADFFAFVLTQYPELADFEGDILTDGVNVVIPGSVMARIEAGIQGFGEDFGKDFSVYDQTASGVGHGLSPFEF